MRWLILAMTIGLIGPALGQTTTFYDKQGNRKGSVTQDGSQSVERDKQGNRIGSYATEGGHVVYRDKQGNRIGSSQTR